MDFVTAERAVYNEIITFALIVLASRGKFAASITSAESDRIGEAHNGLD